jgi:hypothetical protein
MDKLTLAKTFPRPYTVFDLSPSALQMPRPLELGHTSSQGKQTLAAPKTGVWQGGDKGGDKGILSFWLVKKPLRITDFLARD